MQDREQSKDLNALEDHLEKLKQNAIQALSIILRSALQESGLNGDLISKIEGLKLESHTGILTTLKQRSESEEMLTDINLAIALATLVSAIYKFNEEEQSLLELLASPVSKTEIREKSLDSLSHLSDFKLAARFDVETLSQEKRELLVIIQQLMEHIKFVACSLRVATSVQDSANTSQLEFEAVIQSMKGGLSAGEELMRVADAIERIKQNIPAYTNQIVVLSDRQEKIMSAAALTAIIVKVTNTTRRLADQRADFKKQDMLTSMVEQIMKAQQRSMFNQRTELSDTKKDLIDAGRIASVIERQQKRRLGNQEWISKEERFMKEFSELYKLMCAPKRLDDQRFEVSTEGREREIGLRGLFSKIAGVEVRRLGNQEATFSNRSLKKIAGGDVASDSATKLT